MAVAQGYGKTVTSGSVFAYDVGDTRNSYKGEPTVNLLYSAGATNLINGAGDIYGNCTKTDLGNGKFRFVNDGTGGSTVRVYTNQGDLTNGATYACSVYFEDLIGSISIDWCDTGITGINYSTNPSGRLEGYGTRGTYDGPYYFLDINFDSGGAVTLYDPQVELKSHVTPFTAGTRSATQGLLPLAGNSTIDLSNVSFDSNAQMTFDGTNDYIAASNPADYRMGTSNFTLECVMKQSKTTGHCLLESRGDSLAGYLWVHNYYSTGQGCLFLNYGGNQYLYFQDGGFVATTTTQYYHMAIVINRADNVISFYVNGNKAGNNVSIHSNSISPTGGDIYRVGFDLGGSPWLGEIPVFKHYNRALTAAEVNRNYRHYKTRFNLS